MSKPKMTDRCTYPRLQPMGANFVMADLCITQEMSHTCSVACPTFQEFEALNKLVNGFLDNAMHHHNALRVRMAWCPEELHPGKPGADQRKAHQAGVAVDIYSAETDPLSLMRLLADRGNLPFQLMELEGDHVHVVSDAYQAFTRQVNDG